VNAQAPSGSFDRRRCRHCGAALDALAQRSGRGVCGAAACRHAAATAHAQRLREATAQRALQLTAQHQPPPALVVWLQHHEPVLVPLGDEERQQHQAYLAAVVHDGIVVDTDKLAAHTADDSHPQGGRLCGQCRGRCCEAGAGWRAFIDLPLLQRWCAEHEGATLEEAQQAYLALLPPEHVQGGCLYQTAQGCAMPRERRAGICNGFACEPLQQVQQLAAADAAATVVAITFHRDQVERAAVIGADHTRPLALQAGPAG
jgi:hypothetical protein